VYKEKEGGEARVGVLQCVAVCCSVLQFVVVCCSVLQCVAVRGRVGQCVIASQEECAM